jgi:hypothetical protein
LPLAVAPHALCWRLSGIIGCSRHRALLLQSHFAFPAKIAARSMACSAPGVARVAANREMRM